MGTIAPLHNITFVHSFPFMRPRYCFTGLLRIVVGCFFWEFAEVLAACLSHFPITCPHVAFAFAGGFWIFAMMVELSIAAALSFCQ